MDVVLAWEEGLPFEHLCEDATSTPDIDCDVVFLPGQHDLGCTVISRRDIARHLGILNTCKTKVTDLEIAVFIDEDIRGFQISVDYTSRVNVFETPLINGIG